MSGNSDIARQDEAPRAVAALGESIELAGCISRKDWLRAAKLCSQGWTYRRITALGIVLVFSLVIFAAGWSSRRYDADNSLVVMLVAGVGFPVVLLIFYVWSRIQVHRRFKQYSSMAADHRTLLTDTGIETHYEHVHQQTDWAAIAGFRIVDGIVLFYHPSSAIPWMFLTRTRFPDEASWERFLRFLDARLPQR